MARQTAADENKRCCEHMIKLLVNLVLPQQWKIYCWMNLTECIRPSNAHLSMQNLPFSKIFRYTFGVQMSTLADGARICSRLRFTSLQMLCGAPDFGSDKFLPETAYMENKQSLWFGSYRHSVLEKMVIIPFFAEWIKNSGVGCWPEVLFMETLLGTSGLFKNLSDAQSQYSA